MCGDLQLNSTLRDKERRFREKEQGYITKANEVDNEMRQLRARTAEACMELEELQDEVALLERKVFTVGTRTFSCKA